MLKTKNLDSNKDLVISIDGGGIYGIIACEFLSKVWDKIPLDRVACVAGTSVGGLISLGINMGINPNDIANDFQNYAKEVFSGKRWLDYFWAKYPLTGCEKVMKKWFGNTKIKDLKPGTLIPVFDTLNWQGSVIETGTESEVGEYVWEAACAAIAAPTFFPAYKSRWLDGGAVVNNPSIIGIAWMGGKCKVLSVGCGNSPLGDLLPRNGDLGSLYWVQRIMELFVVGSDEVQSDIAKLLLGDDYCRIQFTLPKELDVDMDQVSIIPELRKWAKKIDLDFVEKWLEEKQ